LPIGVAQPDYQGTQQTRHNNETHVAIILSQPFAALSSASTQAFGYSNLRVPDTLALRGWWVVGVVAFFVTCRQATSYWETAFGLAVVGAPCLFPA
jgi:hypothetical protein